MISGSAPTCEEGEGRLEVELAHDDEADAFDEAQLPPAGGEEGCHGCPMVGHADPVHPHQGQDIIHQAPDRVQAQTVLGEGERFHQDVVGADEVFGAFDQVDPHGTGSGMELVVTVQNRE
ncbi:hypothetical protein [Nitrospira sp. Kam-Ns4a]